MYRIKKVDFKNEPVLGNLSIDFTNSNGKIADTIIFAGENGAGKSTILEHLFLALSGDPKCGNMSITIDNEGKEDLLNYEIRYENGTEQTWVSDMNGFQAIVNASQYKEKYHFSAIFSDVDINFHARDITSVTSMEIDEEKASRRSNPDLATQIKQFIVDIDNADALEAKNSLECAKEKFQSDPSPELFTKIKTNTRLGRFTKAFNNVFENLRYDHVENGNNKKNVFFLKHNNQITIDALSSGEKQIVYRGCFLLKDVNALTGTFVFIDEPEISMHPRWQQKILPFYQNLYKDDEGKQTSQMFVATHSQYVLDAGLKSSDSIIVRLFDHEGEVKYQKITVPYVLPIPTAAEINYFVFGILSNDYHIELYSYLQGKLNKKKILDCDAAIEASTQYASNISKYYKKQVYGTTEYKTLPTYIRNCIDHPDNGCSFTQEELKLSTELLIELCK